MKDRIPQYPGRVKLTPVSGQDGVFDMVRADEPTQEGTPLNKGTLLADETAEILGLNPADNPTVNDGLLAAFLAARGGCLLKITPTVNGEVAKAGIPISGASSLTSDELVTTGSATLYAISTTATTTLTVDALLDLENASETIDTPQGSIVEVALGLTVHTSGQQVFSSSTVVQFSPYATEMDICCVGGGGSGGAGGGNGGGGGGGGYVTNQLGIAVVPYTDITIAVGSGGIGGTGSGSSGGTTSAHYKTAQGSTLQVSAGGGGGGGDSTNGYVGGTGNGNGGAGSYYGSNPGGSGTIRRFNEPTDKLYSGGGGGSPSGSGGAPYGGSGGDSGSNGNPANGVGGGGGGGGRTVSASGRGGDGYRGEVVIRWGDTQ